MNIRITQWEYIYNKSLQIDPNNNYPLVLHSDIITTATTTTTTTLITSATTTATTHITNLLLKLSEILRYLLRKSKLNYSCQKRVFFYFPNISLVHSLFFF